MAFIKPGKYASDFTEFHHKRVGSNITMMDLDAVQFKVLPDGSERLRLIEYKGTYEKKRVQQMKVLKRFAKYFKFLNKGAVNTIFEVYMVVADFRMARGVYSLKDDCTIHNLIEKNSVKILEDDLICFLEFNCDWKELIGKAILR